MEIAAGIGVGVLALVGFIIAGGVAIAGGQISSSGSSSFAQGLENAGEKFEDFIQNAAGGTGSGTGVKPGIGIGAYDPKLPSYDEYDSSGELKDTELEFSNNANGTVDTRPSLIITNNNTYLDFFTETGEWKYTEVYNPSGVLIETIYPPKIEEEEGTQAGTLIPGQNGTNNDKKKDKKKNGCDAELPDVILLPLIVVAIMAFFVSLGNIQRKKKKGAKK